MSTVLITGGTGKFGSILVDYFCQKGMQVVFTSTSAEKIAKLVGAYSENNRSITGVQVDFSVESSVSCVMQQLAEKNISVDFLVNNARSLTSLAIEPDGSVSRENFLAEYLLDVVVPYELTMALSKFGDGGFQETAGLHGVGRRR